MYRDLTFQVTVRNKTPEPAAGEVLIQPIAASVCGSDYHFASIDADGRPGSSVPAKGLELGHGLILGHEFAGRIAGVGDGVRDFQIGEIVTADSVIPCRAASCESCRDRQSNYCPQLELVGFQRPGAFAEFITLPAASVYSLEELIPVFGKENAVIIGTQCEPLGVAWHAVTRARDFWKLKRKPSCSIRGAGPLGLHIAAIARVFGFEPIIVAETHSHRRVLAGLFADFVYDPRTTGAQAGAPFPGPVDFTFECCGAATLEDLASQTKPGGRIFWLARKAQKLNVAADALISRGIGVEGIRGHVGFIPPVIKALWEGLLDPLPIITRRLDGLETLLDWLQHPPRFLDEGKVVVQISK